MREQVNFQLMRLSIESFKPLDDCHFSGDSMVDNKVTKCGGFTVGLSVGVNRLLVIGTHENIDEFQKRSLSYLVMPFRTLSVYHEIRAQMKEDFAHNFIGFSIADPS